MGLGRAGCSGRTAREESGLAGEFGGGAGDSARDVWAQFTRQNPYVAP